MLLGDQINPKELIYIPRGKTKKRACINELEIYAVLAPLGFQMRCLDSLTVQDQLILFRQAACIISPHGAALMNLIACYPKTAVIEFIPGYGDFSHYYMMSDLLGLRHGHVIGQCIDNRTGSFYVSPMDVLTILNQLSIY
jgi:capsular polysaccharide biosynthesis protein